MLSRSINSVFLGSVLYFLFALNACKEKPPEPEKKTASVQFQIAHSWENDSLRDSTWNVLSSTEKVKIEFFAYRIARLTLHMSNGNTYVADNYEFINAFQPHRSVFTLKSVPPGEYNGISFLIGVDSVRNHSGAQEGALDPANGLYWEWNTGYIFSMLEGRCIKGGTDTSSLSYHIGLDKYLVQHTKINMLPLTVTDTERKIVLKMNVAEVFKSPNTIVLATDGAFTHSTDHPELAEKIKQNYTDCFSFIKAE